MTLRTQAVKVKEYQHVVDYQQESSQPSRNRPLFKYYGVREEPDHYLDHSLLDSVDSAQHSEVTKATDDMLQVTRENGITEADFERL